MNTNFKKAKKLKTEGKSYEQIGEALGMTKSAAYRLLQNPPKNSEEDESNEATAMSGKSNKEVDLNLAYKLKKLELKHAKEMREMDIEEEARRLNLEGNLDDLQFEIENLRAEMERLVRANEELQKQEELLDDDEEDFDEDSEISEETDDDDEFELPEKLQDEYATVVSEILSDRDRYLFKMYFSEQYDKVEALLEMLTEYAMESSFSRKDTPHYEKLQELNEVLEAHWEEVGGNILFGTYCYFRIPQELFDELQALM